MATEEAHDLGRPHRMPDQYHVFQTETIDEAMQIICERVVVVALPGVTAAAMATLVICITARMRTQMIHLVLPDVAVHGPTVHEDDGSSRSRGTIEQDCPIPEFNRIAARSM